MSDQSEVVVPAEIEIKQDSSSTAKSWLRSGHLIELLGAYVSEADAGLPRDQFLRLVISRIVDDLSSPIPHSRRSAI